MTKNEAAVSKVLARAGSEPTADLTREGVAEISKELRHLLADVFALYLKTKNFHWHMSGVHFRDYHLLLDGHAEQIFAMSDDIAERARKIGAPVQKLGVGHIRQVEERNECFRTLLSAGGVRRSVPW